MQTLLLSQNKYQISQRSIISLPGLLFVLAIHAGLFYFFWNQKLIPPPERMVTLFAQLITPAAPIREQAPNPVNLKPQPTKVEPVKKTPPPVKVKEQQMTTKTATKPEQKKVELPQEHTSDFLNKNTAESQPTAIASAQPTQMPAAPMTLSSELSVSCPKQAAPIYPAISRRMSEEGKLVLRVELDEKGNVDNAKVINSSGYERLDNAALTAVKNWHCNPSLRDGQPVRAVALQPFNFVLQGN